MKNKNNILYRIKNSTIHTFVKNFGLILYSTFLLIKEEYSLILLFIVIFAILKIIRDFYLHRYVFDIDISDSIVRIKEYSNFFKTKMIDYNIDEIKKFNYNAKSGLFNGDIYIVLENRHQYMSSVHFLSNSKIHQKFLNIKNRIEKNRINKIETIALNNEVLDSINSYYLSNRVLNYEMTFGILLIIIAVVIYFFTQNTIVKYTTEIALIPLILHLMSPMKRTLYGIKKEGTIINLFVRENKTNNKYSFDIAKIKHIEYSKKIFLINGELNIILDENEQLIFPIRLSVSSDLNNKILDLIQMYNKKIHL